MKVRIRAAGSELSNKAPTSTVINSPGVATAQDDADSRKVAAAPTVRPQPTSPAHDRAPVAAPTEAPPKLKKKKRDAEDRDIPDKKKKKKSKSRRRSASPSPPPTRRQEKLRRNLEAAQ